MYNILYYYFEKCNLQIKVLIRSNGITEYSRLMFLQIKQSKLFCISTALLDKHIGPTKKSQNLHLRRRKEFVIKNMFLCCQIGVKG